MNYQTKNYKVVFFNRIKDISNEIWSELNCESNFYFHRDFLESLEKNQPEIVFKYIVLFDKTTKAVAFLSLQIIDFELDTIKNNLELFIKKLQKITSKIPFFPSPKPLKILIAGNTFVSGEHGIFIVQTADKKEVLKQFSKALLHIANSQKKLNIDAFLFKDFVNESLETSSILKDLNYHSFSVEPNMVLNIDENWQTIDDYLAALKTKFRVKARKAFQQSKELQSMDITIENMTEHLPKITHLYQKVASNAGFNLSNFNLETYQNLKEKFGQNYIVKSYWLHDKMVGFLSGIINNKTLDAHFVGIDYSRNKQYAIYQRMLYDYIEISIQKKLNTLNFGRTASEIKSSVGAVPQDLTMYLRHKKRITNRILKLFLQRVQPTPFQQKYPFKNQDTP